MKPDRSPLVTPNSGWHRCLGGALALCLASCASVDRRPPNYGYNRRPNALAASALAMNANTLDPSREAQSASAGTGAAVTPASATVPQSAAHSSPAGESPTDAAQSPTTVAAGNLEELEPPAEIRADGAIVPPAPLPAEPDEEAREQLELSSDGESAANAAGEPGDRTLLDREVAQHVPPLEDGDLAYPINLASALKLSDARPLVVAAAQAGAWVAEAELQRAQVIWVPTLNMGANYIRHDGFGPDFNRGLNTEERPLNQNVNFLYAGLGLTNDFALTDAIYEPLVARQNLNARRFDIQTAKNDALLATARNYFDVHEKRGQYAGALDVVRRGEKLAERIEELSTDLVPKVEVARARRLLAAVEQTAALKRENWRVSSANLTQILRLDPRVVVVPAEMDHLQITLIDPARGLDDLIPLGLTHRPELSSQQGLVNAVAERIRREQGRMVMPSILLNGFQTPNELLQVGAQGFGADRSLNLWSVRNDISPQVMWRLEALGMGNLARIKEQRGEQSKAIVELFKAQDAVAADVTRAQARLQSASVRCVQAERSLREAIIAFDGNYEGLAQTRRFGDVLVQMFRPQEAVIALRDLKESYDQYFRTVADYNRAQFELYHALGYPALDIANLHTPGESLPVDTTRPPILPRVESGPPAATR